MDSAKVHCSGGGVPGFAGRAPGTRAYLRNARFGCIPSKPRLRRRGRQAGSDLRTRCAACLSLHPLVRERPRVAKPGTAGGDHGGWQASHRQRPGIDRYAERSSPQTLKEARENVEREMVQNALRRQRGKVTSAALELGISRPTLYERGTVPGGNVSGARNQRHLTRL